MDTKIWKTTIIKNEEILNQYEFLTAAFCAILESELTLTDKQVSGAYEISAHLKELTRQQNRQD